MEYLVLAYYHLTHIEDPQSEVARHQAFLKDKDVSCRIYISHQGINGQFSGVREDAEAFMAWLQKDFSISFKVHRHHEHVFPRKTVKYRPQLVALDAACDLSQRGVYLTPEAWKERLSHPSEGRLIVDVRNDYEWKVGHFERAISPPARTFREFRAYAEELKKRISLSTEILMCCTGGIRCEFYSSYLKSLGFTDIFQLQGGIIQYGLVVGNAHWKGKLFVFDDRLTIPISNEPTEALSHCCYCHVSEDRYLNCANAACNTLFIVCPRCAYAHEGCCSSSCRLHPKKRTLDGKDLYKPFRKKENHSYCLV